MEEVNLFDIIILRRDIVINVTLPNGGKISELVPKGSKGTVVETLKDGYYLVSFEDLENGNENYYGIKNRDMDIIWSSKNNN